MSKELPELPFEGCNLVEGLDASGEGPAVSIDPRTDLIKF